MNIGENPAENVLAHSNGTPAVQHHSARYAIYVIGLLSLVNVCNYMDRMALSVLLPLIKSDLELSDAQLGLLVGFAFSLFYAIFGLPIAFWADRGVRRNIIAVALTAWSVLTALSGFAQNFWQLFAARVGVGVGEAGGLTPAQSILCDYIPPARRPGAFAVHDFGLYLGMMVGLSLAGVLGQSIGWRWTFVVLGLPGIILALVVRFTLREPPRGLSDPGGIESTPLSLRHVAGFLSRCRTYQLLMIFSTLNGFVQYGLGQWLPSFYDRVHHLSLAATGAWLGAAMGVGAAIGLLIGGIAATVAARRDPRYPLIIAGVAVGLAAPSALASLLVNEAQMSLSLVSLTSLLWTIPNGAVLATMYTVLRPRTRAVGGAVTIFATSLFGFGVGPFVVGILSDNLAPAFGPESLRYALLLPASILPLMAVALFVAARSAPADLEAAKNKLEKV